MKRLALLLLIMLTTLGGWAQKSKVLKHSKKSITFVVDKDLPAPKQQFTILPGESIASGIVGKMNIPAYDYQIVKTSFDNERFCYLHEDNFYKCIVQAFADHRPLVLSPDMVWLIIGQGFSRYVNAHSEQLRDKLVFHEGKMTLRVEENNDILGPKGDWEKLLNDFSIRIAANTNKDVAGMMTANFTTTGVTERIASQVTLMETVKTYFDYWNAVISCGIPYITLQGTPEDWQKVREKARGLSKFGLETWANELDPILAEFVKASEGHPNQAFWEDIVMKNRVDKFQSKKVCGLYDINSTTLLDGWFLKFFPDEWGRTKYDMIWAEDMPSEMSRANFIQAYIDPLTGKVIKEVPMQLWAGFVGVQVDEKTGALTPKIGWLARIAGEDDDKLSHLRDLNGRGRLSYSYYHDSDTLPRIISKLERIKRLELNFNSHPVNVPVWLDTVIIDQLKIRGIITEAEEAQLRQRFPNVEIDQIEKPKPPKEQSDSNAEIDQSGKPIPQREKSDSIKAIDISEFKTIAFDPYDIRSVLE